MMLHVAVLVRCEFDIFVNLICIQNRLNTYILLLLVVCEAFIIYTWLV